MPPLATGRGAPDRSVGQSHLSPVTSGTERGGTEPGGTGRVGEPGGTRGAGGGAARAGAETPERRGVKMSVWPTVI